MTSQPTDSFLTIADKTQPPPVTTLSSSMWDLASALSSAGSSDASLGDSLYLRMAPTTGTSAQSKLASKEHLGMATKISNPFVSTMPVKPTAVSSQSELHRGGGGGGRSPLRDKETSTPLNSPVLPNKSLDAFPRVLIISPIAASSSRATFQATPFEQRKEAEGVSRGDTRLATEPPHRVSRKVAFDATTTYQPNAKRPRFDSTKASDPTNSTTKEWHSGDLSKAAAAMSVDRVAYWNELKNVLEQTTAQLLEPVSSESSSAVVCNQRDHVDIVPGATKRFVDSSIDAVVQHGETQSNDSLPLEAASFDFWSTLYDSRCSSSESWRVFDDDELARDVVLNPALISDGVDDDDAAESGVLSCPPTRSTIIAQVPPPQPSSTRS